MITSPRFVETKPKSVKHTVIETVSSESVPDGPVGEATESVAGREGERTEYPLRFDPRWEYKGVR